MRHDWLRVLDDLNSHLADRSRSMVVASCDLLSGGVLCTCAGDAWHGAADPGGEDVFRPVALACNSSPGLVWVRGFEPVRSCQIGRRIFSLSDQTPLSTHPPVDVVSVGGIVV